MLILSAALTLAARGLALSAAGAPAGARAGDGWLSVHRGHPSADEIAALCAVLGLLLQAAPRPHHPRTTRVHTWAPPWHCPPGSWRHHDAPHPSSRTGVTPRAPQG